MWTTLDKAMQYSDRGKFRRSRIRIGWMFPLLAICSLLMNGSMHLRRTRAVMSEIERGPPATTVPAAGGKKANKPSPKQNTKQTNNAGPAKGGGATTKNKKARKPVAVGRVGTGHLALPPLPKKKDTQATHVSTKKKLPFSPLQKESTQKKPKERVAKLTKADLTTKTKVEATEKTQEEVVAKAEVDLKITEKDSEPITKPAVESEPITKPEVDFGPKSEDASLPSSVSRQALTPNATLSACLLVRDDNDIINEWVAYHYHVLRMRRIIVAVDPNSETSPASVLDAWKDYMEIDLWTDAMYMTKEFLETGIPPAEYVENITKFGDITYEEMMGVNAHRYRQRYFLGQCFQKLKEEHRTFALHIDTDEYIVPNKLFRRQRALPIQPASQPGSILDLVQELVESDPKQVAYPCITMLRLLFGSVENQEDEWAPMPTGFDRNSFETLRWRYHGSHLNKKMHGHPKVLVDVSKIPKRFLSKKVVNSIHRPFVKFCRGQGESDYSAFNKYPITANHYLGSWERYNVRNDTRRSWSMYNEKATVSSGEDTWVQGWLEGFIKDVGRDEASRLLGQRYLKTEAVSTTTS